MIAITSATSHSAARAESTWCDGEIDLSRRAGVRLHKALIEFPEEDQSSDENERAKVAKAVTKVLVDYGAMPSSPILVRATDAQLRKLEERGLWVKYADTLDYVFTPGAIIDTTEADADAKQPSGWGARVQGKTRWWVVHFHGEMLAHVTWLLSFNDPELPYTFFPDDRGSILVKMTASQAARVAKRAEVQWVAPYQPLWKISPFMAGESCSVPFNRVRSLARAAGTGKTKNDRIVIHASLAEAAPGLADDVKRAGGKLEWIDGENAWIEGPRSIVRVVATRDEVIAIEEGAVPSLGTVR